MRFRNLKKWDLSSDLDGLVFFAQRMEELLFDYSLDSYKPSALNTPSLIKECIAVITDVEEGKIHYKNIDHILDELEATVQADIVAKSMLTRPLGKYLESRSDNLQNLKLRLEVLSNEISLYNYLEQVFIALEIELTKNRKSNIDFLTKTLACTLINIGLSKVYLYEKVLNFFYFDKSFKISKPEDIKKFFQEIYPYEHKFTVHFKASKLISDVSESVKSFKIQISEKVPDNIKKFAEEKKFHANKNEVFVTVSEINSLDIYTAMIEAEKRLSQLANLLLVYYHKDKITCSDTAIVEQCCVDFFQLAKKPKSVLENGIDLRPDKASKKLNDFIKNTKFTSSKKGFYQFNRLVDLHGMSVSNDIAENQLLNLWSSLETLAPLDLKKNTIDSILKQITPTLMLNYNKRIIDRYAADLFNWNKFVSKRILTSIPNTKNLDYSKKCLHLLALEENADIRKELYNSLGDFHLLRNRTYLLHQHYSSKKKYKDFLKSHEERISWQIRRIYRTRNLIVHSGKTPSYINPLIENTHDYLDQIISTLSLLSSNHLKMKNFDEIFEYTKLEYDRIKGFLGGDDSFSSSNIITLYWET
jgi:hypothetical protein